MKLTGPAKELKSNWHRYSRAYTYVTQENHNEPLNAVWLWRMCKYTNATCICTCVRYKGGIYQWHLSQHTALYKCFGHWLVTVTLFLPDFCLWMTVIQWQSLSHFLWQHTILFAPFLVTSCSGNGMSEEEGTSDRNREVSCHVFVAVINNGEDKVRYLLSQVLLAVALNVLCSPSLA